MKFHQKLKGWNVDILFDTDCVELFNKLRSSDHCLHGILVYLLLVTTVVVCGSVFRDLFYHSATVIFTRNILLIIVCLEKCNFVAVFTRIDAYTFDA